MKALPAMPLTSCHGKRQYGSYGEADRVATRVRRQEDGVFVGAYHCTNCKRFHVGANREHGRHDRRREE